MKGQQGYIFGLDILRSFAIWLVLLSHSAFILQKNYPSFPFIPTPDGVDLFFVLSGFLIGSGLLKQIDGSETLGLKQVFGFLKRRWFKTLPSYYLFLLINILLTVFGLLYGTINVYAWTYTVFLQNFHKPIDFFFWESWSLAVEEWFYLLFPLCLLVFHRFFKLSAKKAYVIGVLLMLVIPLWWRFYMILPDANHDLYFRRLVLSRLDTIAFGLLGAYLFRYHSLVWEKTKYLSLVVGLLLITYLFRFGENYQPQFYHRVFADAEALGILCLLPFLNALSTEKIRFKPFRFTSKISYAMYLVNLPVILLCKPYLSGNTASSNLAGFATLWIVIYLLSYLWYRYVEKPLMDLRER